MAILPIYNCFHPLLKKKTEPVNEIDSEIKKLIEDMFQTMYFSDGIGLAANQVGVSKSIITIDVSPTNRKNAKKIPPIAMINPVIEVFSDDEVDISEGCLSVPDLHENVMRPSKVQAIYYDISGKEHKIEGDEMLARVIQHEFDHLNGILFYERLSPLRRTLLKNKLKNIRIGKTILNYPMILPDGTRIEGEEKED